MQLDLFVADDLLVQTVSGLTTEAFSHGNVCPQGERLALEMRYAALLEETDVFNRKLVSYQGNKGELVHGWIRYKEGFSAQLVATLIQQFGILPGDTILEPFAGSATTLLAAKSLGIDAVGIEILPVCHLAWQAKSHVFNYDIAELRRLQSLLVATEPGSTAGQFPHITITEGAFSTETEHDLMFYTAWCENLTVSALTKTLCRLVLASILEEISYTRKDGQYLRWDHRSSKVQTRNQIRISQGKTPIKEVDKGALPSVKTALMDALDIVIADIAKLQQVTFRESHQELIKGNTLRVLPTLASDQFAGVITSPPYCNRYDYTRTYALEIAYLGAGQEIHDLRQGLLSCTVENRPKLDALALYYASLGQSDRFTKILQTVQRNPVFIEINQALRARWDRQEINNRGVLGMVEQYFTELTFVFAELLRVCRRGAYVAFVNDNVRYGGEIIPVDLFTTNLAEDLGFEPVRVHVLPQRKGNSSQQMEKFGREALRKSITVWRKP
ncbi:MAG: DNA methyltransferase [Chloroflexi bacterium]|nr:DNA methyltransferase [Chloroflexota bacterium]